MSERADQHPPCILVVDDTADNAKLLVDLLERQGYQVSSSASGPEALAALSREPCDLVLLDVVMPEMDGYEVCRRIRQHTRFATLPVVMVTALDAKEERVKGLEAGADDFLSRPINHPELLARVRSLLRIKRMHDYMQRQALELADWASTLEQRVARGVAEVERLSRLKRFFSPKVAELIVSGAAGDPLHGHRREIVVIYLDLRGFTAFAESWEPEEVMRALAAYHAAMGRIVVDYEATLERFTGDAMMVFLGDPVVVEKPAGKAVSLAIAMRDAALALSANWKKRGVDLGLAIGIDQGFATVGAIGFEGRVDYAAIGTVTNLACRLCQHARGGEIFLSQRLFSEVEDLVEAADLGELPVHGFSRPIRVYRCDSLATRRVIGK
ncbi:MAG: response regulator [Betaproteobacteria bacterium]|nr:MAG: response regulator [Betaproteobacteria bacterium]